MAIGGMWTGNDGAAYFIGERAIQLLPTRRVKIWWVGIRPDLSWANVFRGTRTGDRVTGEWADVPKGGTGSHGNLEFRIDQMDFGAGDGPQDFDTLFKLNDTGGFGCTEWKRGAQPGLGEIPTEYRPFYAETSLTGGWHCNDGGHYYLRQVGNNVFWFGENKEAGWANVLFGQISGNVIEGDWVDVPKGQATNHGTMRLRLSGGPPFQRMDREGLTGPFGGSAWVRRDFYTALAVNVHKLRCLEETDEVGDDEPYFIVHSINMDNTLSDYLPIPGSHTFRSRVFDGDDSVAEGDERTVDLRIWGTQLAGNQPEPAPIANPQSAMILVGLVENDNGEPDTVAAMTHTACTTATLTSVASGHDFNGMYNFIHETMEGAIKGGGAMGGINFDELIDVDKLRFSDSELWGARLYGITITKTLKGDGGHYKADIHIHSAFHL